MKAQPVRADEDDEYRNAMANYDASFMSNAKWLRLFRAVIQAGISIERAEWRFIGSAHSLWQSFPSERDLMPTRFSDGKFQPFEYRWLESVFIPSRFGSIVGVGYEQEQDTRAIAAVLDVAGQFSIEKSESGLTIYAYRRRISYPFFTDQSISDNPK